MTELFRSDRPEVWDVEIFHGQDFWEQLAFVDPLTGDPANMTGVELQLYFRPRFNHDVRFALLTTSGSSGIIADDPSFGLFSFFKPRAEVEAQLPLSGPTHWEQFLRAVWSEPGLGSVSQLVWTGDLYVRPARLAPTP